MLLLLCFFLYLFVWCFYYWVFCCLFIYFDFCVFLYEIVGIWFVWIFFYIFYICVVCFWCGLFCGSNRSYNMESIDCKVCICVVWILYGYVCEFLVCGDDWMFCDIVSNSSVYFCLWWCGKKCDVWVFYCCWMIGYI